jgi:pectinesterase
MKHLRKFLTLILVSAAMLPAAARQYSMHITVAKDGSGDFTSIQAAILSCKSFPYQRITIYVKNGVYHEKVRVPAWNTKISLIGESEDSTIITWGDYFSKIDKGPNSTFFTATLTVEGNDFHAENLTIKNSAGPVGQALALDVEADRCSFSHCKILGHQDTIYLTGEGFRDFFTDCRIEGTTDFIFGQATALFEDCTIHCLANSYITAASTSKSSRWGFVFKNCRITAAPGVTGVMLGRPWRKYAKTVYIDCDMGGFIRPRGWDNWRDTANEKTVYYGEYHSTGAGADPSGRVKWAHHLTRKQASQYTAARIFTGCHPWNPENTK